MIVALKPQLILVVSVKNIESGVKNVNGVIMTDVNMFHHGIKIVNGNADHDTTGRMMTTRGEVIVMDAEGLNRDPEEVRNTEEIGHGKRPPQDELRANHLHHTFGTYLI